MIYLTGQLLVFLLVTAMTGFIIGWLMRGAMIPVSMLNNQDVIYQTKGHSDAPGYLSGQPSVYATEHKNTADANVTA